MLKFVCGLCVRREIRKYMIKVFHLNILILACQICINPVPSSLCIILLSPCRFSSQQSSMVSGALTIFPIPKRAQRAGKSHSTVPRTLPMLSIYGSISGIYLKMLEAASSGGWWPRSVSSFLLWVPSCLVPLYLPISPLERQLSRGTRGMRPDGHLFYFWHITHLLNE